MCAVSPSDRGSVCLSSCGCVHRKVQLQHYQWRVRTIQKRLQRRTQLTNCVNRKQRTPFNHRFCESVRTACCVPQSVHFHSSALDKKFISNFLFFPPSGLWKDFRWPLNRMVQSEFASPPPLSLFVSTLARSFCLFRQKCCEKVQMKINIAVAAWRRPNVYDGSNHKSMKFLDLMKNDGGAASSHR